VLSSDSSSPDFSKRPWHSQVHHTSNCRRNTVRNIFSAVQVPSFTISESNIKGPHRQGAGLLLSIFIDSIIIFLPVLLELEQELAPVL